MISELVDDASQRVVGAHMRGGLFPRRNEFGWAKQAADVVCMASDHGTRTRYAYKTLRASWLPDSLVTRIRVSDAEVKRA